MLLLSLVLAVYAMLLPPVTLFYPIVVHRLRESGRIEASSRARQRQRAHTEVALLRRRVERLERQLGSSQPRG